MSQGADHDLPASASPEERAALRRTQTVARVLDDAIPVPGIDYRIGLDPLIGFFRSRETSSPG